MIARGVGVTAVYVDAGDAAGTAGLVRSMSVAPPPTPDGRLRIIDIEGIDRQACGGTHLANTGQSRPIVITKVENKGRHDRRVRFAFAYPRLAPRAESRSAAEDISPYPRRMQIVSALFVENFEMRQAPGPSTRLDLTGAMFSMAAPSRRRSRSRPTSWR